MIEEMLEALNAFRKTLANNPEEIFGGLYPKGQYPAERTLIVPLRAWHESEGVVIEAFVKLGRDAKFPHPVRLLYKNKKFIHAPL